MTTPLKHLLFALLAAPTLALAEPATVDALSPDALNGVSSSLTLYVYPPRNPLDWRSPGRALKSIIGNLLGIELTLNHDVSFTNLFGEPGTLSSNYRSSMGHTLAHIRCSLRDGEVVDRWASFSGEDYPAADKQLLLTDKVGLGVLFAYYIDGHIIAGEENVKRITFYKGDSEHGERIRPRYIQLEVDAEHCLAMKRMVEFYLSYHFAPGSPYEALARRAPEDTLYFTNMIDPFDAYQQRLLTGKGVVGGGCAPFGAALVKAAGRYRPELDRLWRTPLTVSEKLIGNQPDPRTGQLRRVSLNDLLFTPLGDRWTFESEGYGNRTLNMYDPQRIWDFTGNMVNCLGGRACAEAEGGLLGNERGRIRAGATHLFRDALARTESGGGDSPGPQTRTETVEQLVPGFVWRLR